MPAVAAEPSAPDCRGFRGYLNAGFKAVLADEAVKTRLTNLGMIVIGSSAPEFGKFIDSELTKWASVRWSRTNSTGGRPFRTAAT